MVIGLRREMQAGVEAAKKAIEKAEVSNDKRFDGVNEFRSELTERWRTTMPREAAEAKLKAHEQRIEKIEHTAERRVGGEAALGNRRTAIQPWALWAAGAGLTVMIVLINLVAVFAK